MMSEIISCLKKREQHLIKNSFMSENGQRDDKTSLILSSPSDKGVILNGGRRGTNFGPMAILSTFKTLVSESNHSTREMFYHEETTSQKEEEENYQQATQNQIQRITALLQTPYKKLLHLGGGHDQIFPLLMALSATEQKITVINIDPHLDTRTDELAHSGNPFRRFAKAYTGQFRLLQVGAEEFTNPPSNYEKLEGHEHKILSLTQLRKKSRYFKLPLKRTLSTFLRIKKGECVLLSIDADVISSHTMEGVSAVAFDGIELEKLLQIISTIKEITPLRGVGIYEYNPMFDNLSKKGARAITRIMREYLHT